MEILGGSGVERKIKLVLPAELKTRFAARQGRYAAFHDAMFGGGRPAAASIAVAAQKAGVDRALAAPVAAGTEVTNELAGNLALAKELGITGTPAWVIGDKLLIGAVGREALESAIAETRKPA